MLWTNVGKFDSGWYQWIGDFNGDSKDNLLYYNYDIGQLKLASLEGNAFNHQIIYERPPPPPPPPLLLRPANNMLF